ncbi:MAG: response regulator transcription factor [Rikenellaceae bacterium]|nr:response regulator transcription factor [Rikenellaceae bacterium]
MSTQPYKIFLVDDHTLFRNGLRGLLNSREDCEVVGEASSGEEFLEKLPECDIDVVFMDIAMTGISGDVATARALEMRPDLKVITLSMFGDEDYYFRMVSVGAKGFLLKSSDIDEVVEAIETVAEGGSYFSQELLSSLVSSLRTTLQPEVAPEDEESLSERELEVLLEICKGLSNQQIADKLFISKRTVDKHRANILAKTGCPNTANLVVYAIKHNLVEI